MGVQPYSLANYAEAEPSYSFPFASLRSSLPLELGPLNALNGCGGLWK